jgi:hypothetical protein
MPGPPSCSPPWIHLQPRSSPIYGTSRSYGLSHAAEEAKAAHSEKSGKPDYHPRRSILHKPGINAGPETTLRVERDRKRP